MRNLEHFRQSSILSKNPTALFPLKPSIRLFALDFYVAIVDSAFGLISYPLIEHRNLKVTNHICKLTICPQTEIRQ